MLHISFIFCLLSFAANAQRASAIVDRQKILLGEQLQLELKLDGVQANQLSVSQWFNLPDTFNHLEVVNRSAIDTVDVNGAHTYIQRLTLTGFDSGRWEIPALSVFLSANDNRSRSFATEPISIDVLPVDVSEMKDYHPIKDILEVKPVYDWWLWISIAFGAILLTVLVIWFLKRKKKPKSVAVKHKLPALEEALQALQTLREKVNDNSFSTRAFYLEVENIYRRYFTRALVFDAMQTTPDELIMRLKVDIQSHEPQTNFFQLIRLIAAVKYAKYQPLPSERITALDVTAKTVTYVDQLKGGQK